MAFPKTSGGGLRLPAGFPRFNEFVGSGDGNSGGGSTGGGTGSSGGTGGGGPVTGILAAYDRLVFHFDGDTQDDDDIAALPVAAMLANAAGWHNSTHFFIGNNLNEGDTAWQVDAMRASAAFAEKLGIKIHDYTADVTGSNYGLNDFTNVTAELVAILTSGEKILCLEGGPMEAIYRAIDLTPVQYHSNITLVSHSWWNEGRKVLNAPGATQARDWDDLKADFPNITFIDIENQNGGQNYVGFNDAAWNWLDSETYSVFEDARTAMEGAGANTWDKRNDASDAGMLYYAITGVEFTTVDMAETYLKDNLPTYTSQFTEVEPGLHRIHAEDFAISGSGWVLNTDIPGYIHTGYLTYEGANSYQSQDDATTIEATLEITDPGIYQIQIRSRLGHPSDPSQQNDSWIYINADEFYAEDNGTKIYPKGNAGGLTPVTATNDSSNGFLKFYINTLDAWGMQTSAVDNNPHQIFARFDTAGTYTFKLGGRSNNHHVDMIFLRKTTLNPTVIDPYITQGATVLYLTDADAKHPMSLSDTANNGASIFNSKINAISGVVMTEMDADAFDPATDLVGVDVLICGLTNRVFTSGEKTSIDTWLRAGGAIWGYSDSAAGPNGQPYQNQYGQASRHSMGFLEWGWAVNVDTVDGEKVYNLAAGSILVDAITFELEGSSPWHMHGNPDASMGNPTVVMLHHTQSPPHSQGIPAEYTGSKVSLGYSTPDLGRVLVLGDRQPLFNSNSGSDITQYQNEQLVVAIVKWLARLI